MILTECWMEEVSCLWEGWKQLVRPTTPLSIPAFPNIIIILLFCVCFSAGYKGYGLAMMVEVMCGMLGGGTYAHHIRKWSRDDQRPADLV